MPMQSINQLRKLPKVLLHEHLDCSLRPKTMLDLWSERGFSNSNFPFPTDVIKLWHTQSASNQAKASRKYQDYLCQFASLSLTNYVKAIVDHVLPLMQTSENLYRITKERLDDAYDDGVIAFELRFAPQLHTMSGLSLSEVLDSVVKAVAEENRMHVKLIICALRHENAILAKDLGDLAVKYKDYVSGFDLAADESLNPGVLEWWLTEAIKLRDSGLGLTIHLWETNDPKATDLERLNLGQITRLGHGIRGDRQTGFVLEICPTSNVVTGQVKTFENHPINDLYERGELVTVNTDGTLFTKVTLSKEYQKLSKYFNWGLSHFLKVNQTAVHASHFSQAVKSELLQKLSQA